jgi:hypothetical protein
MGPDLSNYNDILSHLLQKKALSPADAKPENYRISLQFRIESA